MRGIKIGDTVTTQDGKHTGIIKEIRTTKDEVTRNLKFELVIEDKKRHILICDINDVMIF